MGDRAATRRRIPPQQQQQRKKQPPAPPLQQLQQQQQKSPPVEGREIMLTDNPNATATTTLSLSDGVLRSSDGQTVQLIAINQNGEQEYISHESLLNGQLGHEMLLNYITQPPTSPPQLTPTASASIPQQQQVLVETDAVIGDAEEEKEEVTLQQIVSNTEDDGHQNIFQYVSTSSTGSVIQAYTKSLQSTKSLRVRHTQQPPPLAPLQQKKIVNKSTSRSSSDSIMQTTAAQQQQQLPHKKRIATSPLTSSNPPKLLLQSPVQSMPPQQSATANTTTVTVFQCQLCSEPCATQYDFFQHLQSHYESTEAEEAEANTVGIEEPEQQHFGYETKYSETLLQPDQHGTEQTERTNKSVDPKIIIEQDLTGTKQIEEHVDGNTELLLMHVHRSDEVDGTIDDDVEIEDDTVKHDDNDGGEDIEETVYSMDEVYDEDQQNHDAAENTVVLEEETAQWFELEDSDTGDLGDETIFDASVPDNEMEQTIEDVEHIIKDEPTADADARELETAETAEITATEPVTITTRSAAAAAVATKKKSNNKPAKVPNKAKRKSTLASQMECFEEIVTVASSSDDVVGAGGKWNIKGLSGNAKASQATSKSYRCRLCEKVCKTKNSLQYHFLLHTGERPHQCDECGKGFFAKSALNVHMRLHTGDKPYTCVECGRAFRQWGDLRYHIASLHSDEKNHQCEFCGKDFARRYSLVIHRRIHTGERNYKCEFCDKSFRASTYLQDHRRIHTGEKPHACEYCNKKFRVRGDLKRHWNIHMRSDGTRTRVNPANVGATADSVAAANAEQHLVTDDDEAVAEMLLDLAPYVSDGELKEEDEDEEEQMLDNDDEHVGSRVLLLTQRGKQRRGLMENEVVLGMPSLLTTSGTEIQSNAVPRANRSGKNIVKLTRPVPPLVGRKLAPKQTA